MNYKKSIHARPEVYKKLVTKINKVLFKYGNKYQLDIVEIDFILNQLAISSRESLKDLGINYLMKDKNDLYTKDMEKVYNNKINEVQ